MPNFIIMMAILALIGVASLYWGAVFESKAVKELRSRGGKS